VSTLARSRTVGEAVRAVTLALRAAGVEDAGRDARLLVAAVTGGDTGDLIREPERALSAGEAQVLAGMMHRRAAGEPVSRILGWREFYGRRFAITPDVLDPRADTETVIEVALEIARREGWRERQVSILDRGTGSGCLLVTVLAELPLATGTELDISAAALAVARRNAGRLDVTQRCTFVASDIAGFNLDSYDLVVSNPPYIPAADITALDPEVCRFDPHLALDGGADGLRFYRTILSGAVTGHHVASTPQWLVLEAGIGQTRQIIEIACEFGLSIRDGDLILRNDLGNIPRCVALRTRS